MKNKNPHNKKIIDKVQAWKKEIALNPPKSLWEITLIKDAYIKHIQERDGCLIVSNKWEFVITEGKLNDALLEVKGLDSDGKAMKFYVGVNTIINWNKNK